MTAYLLVIRDRHGIAQGMGIYSDEHLTTGVHDKIERAPKPYACIAHDEFDGARTTIMAHMLADKEPWPAELQRFVDDMLRPFRPADPYRSEAKCPPSFADQVERACVLILNWVPFVDSLAASDASIVDLARSCDTVMLAAVLVHRLARRSGGSLTGELDAIANLLRAKNAAYGNAALDPLRIYSKASPAEQIRVRIDDKLSRLARGAHAGEDVEVDLLGYLALLLIADGE